MAEKKDSPEVVTEAEATQRRARQAAAESAGADLASYTETVPGGRYLLDDGETLVDANGKPLKQ